VKFSSKSAIDTAKNLLIQENTKCSFGRGNADYASFYEDLLGNIKDKDSKDDITAAAKRLMVGPTPQIRRNRKDACAIFVTRIRQHDFILDDVIAKDKAQQHITAYAVMDKTLKVDNVSWDVIPDEASISVLIEQARLRASK
jgi:hypothetical protein